MYFLELVRNRVHCSNYYLRPATHTFERNRNSPKTSTSEGSVEADGLEERIDFSGGVGRRGRSFGTFTGDMKATEGTRVRGRVLIFTLKLLDETVDEPVVRALTTHFTWSVKGEGGFKLAMPRDIVPVNATGFV